jgi:hypothetical protein
MRKLKLTIITVIFYCISQQAIASIITADLPENTYITYGGYDWTWASPVSVTNYSYDFFNGIELVPVENYFADPTAHQGWMFISDELSALFENLTLEDFTDTNDDIIHSFSYWNSIFSNVSELSISDFDNILQGSIRNFGDGEYYNLIMLEDGNRREDYETFYVRVAVNSIPEPLTIIIFTLGLIILTIRAFHLKSKVN